MIKANSARLTLELCQLNKFYEDNKYSKTRILDGVNINSSSHYGPHYVLLKGPSQTPYENGIFKLEIILPPNYPFNPPKIKFCTKIYHPNIGTDGTICLDILKDQWAATLRLESTLASISALLDKPNPDDPLSPEPANLLKTNKEAYEKNVRASIDKHAIKTTLDGIHPYIKKSD